jgi:hypothetical protein
MQLGKLGACQSSQGLSCKTGNNDAQFDQWLTSRKQNIGPIATDRLAALLELIASPIAEIRNLSTEEHHTP